MNARKILRSLSICILGAYIFAYIAYASDDTTDNANILGESRWRTEDNVLSISLGTEERDDDAALIGASSVGAGRTRRGRRDEQAQEAPVTHEALFDSPEAVPSIDGYVRINMPGLDQWVDEPGSPLTPCKPVKLLIPYEFEASQVRIERGSIMEIPGEHLIEPAQQPVKLDDEETEEVVFTPPDPVIYGSDDPYPAYPCGDVFIQKKHGYTILFVNLFPVVYYPASRRVAYYTELSVTVDTRSTSTASLTGASSTSAASADVRIRPKLKAAQEISSFIDNPGTVNTYTRAEQNLGASSFDPMSLFQYIIITNEELANSTGEYTFQDLIQSKHEKGLNATIVTTEHIDATYAGVDLQEKIRSCIRDYYRTYDTEFVLLAGDRDVIPVRTLYENGGTPIPADLYYACLDGDFDRNGDGMYGEPEDYPDVFAEVYVGRAAVKTAEEVSNFVRKTLTYDRSNSPYLRNNYIVGEHLGFGGVAEYAKESLELIRTGSGRHGQTTAGFENASSLYEFARSTLYEKDASWDMDDVIGIINSGVHILNHLGHASIQYNMKHDTSRFSEFTNSDHFFAYSQGCLSGAFDVLDCYAEVATTTECGAFAAIMNSRYGWGVGFSTDGASNRYNREFWDALFGEGIRGIGKMHQDAKEDLAHRVNSGKMRWCYYSINLFGDPEIEFKGTSECADFITNPMRGEFVRGEVDIRGVAYIEGIFSGYKLVYVPKDDPDNVVEITPNIVTTPVDTEGSLVPSENGGLWDTTMCLEGEGELTLTIFTTQGDEISRSVTVNVDNINDPPDLKIPNKLAVIGRELEFTVKATDKDEPPVDLMYSVNDTTLPFGATFDPGTQSFSWLPSSSDKGVYKGVTFAVTDGTHTTTESIEICTAFIEEEALALDGYNVGDTVAIDGNRVVWEGETTGDGVTDIYISDLSTDQITQLTNTAEVEDYPDISGDKVVWRYMGSPKHIYARDLSTTDGPIDVYQIQYTLNRPAIHGDWVAWSVGTSINMYNTAIDSTRIRVTDFRGGTREVYNDPSVYNGKVVWGATNSYDSSVAVFYLSDVGTGRGHAEIDNEEHKGLIYGDRVAWIERDDICIYDIPSARTSRMAGDGSGMSATAIYGDSLVGLDEAAGANKGVVMYIIPSKTRFRVNADASSDNLSADIHGDRITWISEPSSGSKEIRVARILFAPAITSAAPTTIGIGDFITIEGTNFGHIKYDDSRVTFAGGVESSDIREWTDTRIVCRVPAGALTGELKVITLGGETSGLPITITVSSNSPILEPVGNKSGNEGENIAFTLVASDPNNDPLTFSASNLPAGSSFDSTSATFTWTADHNDAGDYADIHFEVTDGTNVDSEDITISVADKLAELVVNSGSGDGVYDIGTTVTVNADSEPVGYHFTEWSGDVINLNISGRTRADITMLSDATITANYAITEYTLTMKLENGTVIKNPDRSRFEHGETVELTAVPDADCNFVEWGGISSGTTNPATITMDGNKTVTPLFLKDLSVTPSLDIGVATKEITFEVKSNHPDYRSAELLYDISFGDGSTDSGSSNSGAMNFTHTYAHPAACIVTATVSGAGVDDMTASISYEVKPKGVEMIWVADTYNNKVVILDQNGTVLSKIEGFNRPSGVSVDSDGSCWVADTYNNQVVKLNPDGTTATDVGGNPIRMSGFSSPRSVSVNTQDGSCWVADSGGDEVVKLNPDGTTATDAGGNPIRVGGFDEPSSVSVVPTDGSCWVADLHHSKMVKLDANGVEVIRELGGYYRPTSVSTNPTDGSCWVAQLHGGSLVCRLNPYGTMVASIRTCHLPFSISVDPRDNSAWVADTYNDRIIHLDPDCNMLQEVGGFNKLRSIDCRVLPANEQILTLSATNGHVVKTPDLPTYTRGTTVQLTPVPDEGCYFKGWGGDAAGSDDPLVVTMDGDMTVDAAFGKSMELRTHRDPAVVGVETVFTARANDPDYSGKDLAYDITFGDGASDSDMSGSGAVEFKHTYAGPGNYTVSVTITGPGITPVTKEINYEVIEKGAEGIWCTDSDGFLIRLDYQGVERLRVGGFRSANNISVDPIDNSCWVADYYGNRVIKFDSTGRQRAVATGFEDPNSVSVDPADGSCWVAVYGLDQVVKLNSRGEELARMGGFNSPTSVSVDPRDGSCWVVDNQNNQVVKINSSCTQEIARTGGFTYPISATVNPVDGSCWVADRNNYRVVKLDAYGAIIKAVTGFSLPNSVSVNPADGSCWVSDTQNSQVVKLNSFGTQELLRLGGFNWPQGVKVDPADGSCWVADYNNHQIVKLDSEGNEVLRKDGFLRPSSVALTPRDGYILIINAQNGSVTKNPNKTSYEAGTTVELTPASEAHSTFTGWSGDASGSDVPLVITMDGNKAITANFELDTYTLGTNAQNGSITKIPNQINYEHNTVVALTPVPITGYHFVSWSGGATGSADPLAVTMDSNKTVTANFEIDTYTLTTPDPENGSITKDPDLTAYEYNTTVDLTPVAEAGYVFESWSGDATGSDVPFTITMNGNKTIEAVFNTTGSLELDPIGVKIINEGEPLSFAISATHSENAPLTYSASGLPSGASFDPATQTFSWTPTHEQADVYQNVHFKVTDATSDPGPGPGPGGPVDPNVALLLHLNSSPADSSNNPHTITSHGEARIDTSVAKFGAGSLIIDGADDYLTTPSSADWDIFSSTSDSKTLDFWVKHDDFTQTEGYCGQFQDGSNLWQLFHRGGFGIRLYVSSGGALLADTGYGGPISDTNWHHIALCKVGTAYGIYLDGRQVAYTSSSNTGSYAATLDVGRVVTTSGRSVCIDGYMDEARVSRGNIFNASPNSGLTNRITAPVLEATGSAGSQAPSTPAAGANTASEDITITVVNVNRDPVLNSIGAKTVTEEQLLTFTISASDPDNDTLAYSASNIPSGASFDEVTATFTWTPADGQNRTYPNVRFTVTENTTERKSDHEDIRITVEDGGGGPGDGPIILSPIGTKIINEGEPLSFAISATHADGLPLTYSASSLPSGASFDPNTRTFSWTPTHDQANVYANVHFEVTDAGSGGGGGGGSGGGGVVTDDNIRLLLQSNEAIRDASPNSHTVTSHGEASIDTTTTKFGAGSLTLDGADDYVTIPGHADLGILSSTSDNKTLDFWVKHDDLTKLYEGYCGQFQDSSNLWQLFHKEGDGIRLYVSSGGSLLMDTGYGGAISDNNWHHIAVCKVGTSYGIYLDGRQVAYGTSDNTGSYSATFDIGRVVTTSGRNVCIDGRMDEVRLTRNNYFNVSPNSGLTDSIAVSAAETETTGGSSVPSTPDTSGDSEDANTASEDITITVVNVNRDPVLNSIGNKTTTEETLLTFTISASDPDNDTLAYSASNIPSGASFDEVTATFTWTPADGQNRTYPNVRFTVTENTVERRTDHEDISIRVDNADSGPGPGVDENIELLLHLNSGLADSSNNPHTATSHGEAGVNTSVAKFGAGSLILDGAGDYLATPGSANLDMFSSASGNKTMDFWVKHDDYTKVEGYSGQFQDGDNVWQFFHRGGHGIRLYVRSEGALLADTGYGGPISDTAWHHIALCKVGNSYGIYLDGRQVAHASLSSTATFNSTFDMGRAVSTSGRSVCIDGYIDEVRVSRGNIFNASPNSGLNDTITVPTGE